MYNVLRAQPFSVSPIFHVRQRFCTQAPAAPLLRPLFDLSLCLVTHRPDVESDEDFVWRVMSAVEGGVTCVQLRDQNKDVQASLRTAYRLKELLREKQIPLIINNRLDVALAVQADGIHIGQTDFPYHEARRLMGERSIIGLTVNTLKDVQNAEHLDVDYLGVQLFPSLHTKPHSSQVWGLQGLQTIQRISRHPLMVIGGVNLKNLESVCTHLRLADKKDGTAMVGSLWRAKNPSDIAKTVRATFDRVISRQMNPQ